MEFGDTVQFRFIFISDSIQNISPITVDTISSIDINGTTLKVQHISFTFELYGDKGIITDSIIERIGRIKSFIFSPACGIDITPISNDLLRCYVDNEIDFRSDWWINKFSEAPCDTTINGYTNIDLLKQNEQINI